MSIVTSTSVDGANILEFDDETHSYFLNSHWVPGVSEINGKGFPEAEYLAKWKLEQGIEYGLAHISQCDGPVTEEFYATAVAESKWAWKRKASISTSVGTMLHEYAYCAERNLFFDESRILQHPNCNEILHCIGQFKEYKEGCKNQTLSFAEKAVAYVCDAHDEGSEETCTCYAGTFDKLAVREGKVTLTDYKTSKKISVENWLQLAAYSIAIKEWLGITVEAFEIARFDKTKKAEVKLVTGSEAIAKLQDQWRRNVATYGFIKEWK